MKLKVHRRLNERAWPKTNSRNVSMTLKSRGKSVLLLKGLISKEDVFQEFNWIHPEVSGIDPSGNFREAEPLRLVESVEIRVQTLLVRSLR
ncbi:hypothetical protein TNCV_5096441 [Trichonephila clavipes]|nr:hypothetical protein TNCV_5096441 [Trichonephila clavipes]